MEPVKGVEPLDLQFTKPMIPNGSVVYTLGLVRPKLRHCLAESNSVCLLDLLETQLVMASW